MSKKLGDISNDPNVSVTTDSDGMEDVTFYTQSNVNWFAVAALVGVLYVVFAPEKTKQKHLGVARRTLDRSRQALTAALKAN